MRTKDNTVFITGDSAGIGLATAEALVVTDNTVIVCGRDQIWLERAKQAMPVLAERMLNKAFSS